MADGGVTGNVRSGYRFDSQRENDGAVTTVDSGEALCVGAGIGQILSVKIVRFPLTDALRLLDLIRLIDRHRLACRI